MGCKLALSTNIDALPSKQPPTQTPLILKSAAEALKAQLQSIDQDLVQVARRLSTLGLKSDATRAIIRQLQARRADMLIDASTISPQGIMLLVRYVLVAAMLPQVFRLAFKRDQAFSFSSETEDPRP
jgi:hypothetical protein